MRIPERVLVHAVTVTPYLGTSSVGKVYGDPFTLQCIAQGARRMVRDATGTESLSTLTIYAAPGRAQLVPAGSLVEWAGDTTEVIACAERDSGGLGAPDHTEVVCQ